MDSTVELRGLGVSSGIGIGRAMLLKRVDLNTENHTAPATENSLQAFENALLSVIRQTQNYLSQAKNEEKSGIKVNILDAYIMLLEDSSLTDDVRRKITEDHLNEIQATQSGMDTMVQMFENMEDDYMRERACDIRDIRDRLLMEILHIKKLDLNHLPADVILVAADLTTSDTATLDVKNVAGILTCDGGKNSHTSIMARNFGIPAIVGVGEALLHSVTDGDDIVMDGMDGLAILKPEPKQISEFKAKRKEYLIETNILQQYRDKKSVTKDGFERIICANIGTLGDLSRVLENTADGIGLFRSEFLYMDSSSIPSENKQFEAYRTIALGMEGKPVIIRTLDVGGDKKLPTLNLEKEENPFLGYRAIRICLDQQGLFRTQLTAILRASHFGNVKILFPMISCLEELRKAKTVLYECMDDLRKQNISFNESIKIGIMIEIPAAVVMACELARECDFFSIGTNDLIQYTIAVDRGNKKVAHLYSQYQPAVLRMIQSTINAAHQIGIPCGMCGEAAGDPLMVPVLLGMGLDEFSMNAGSIFKTRAILSGCAIEETKVLARKVLSLSTLEDVVYTLDSFMPTSF